MKKNPPCQLAGRLPTIPLLSKLSLAGATSGSYRVAATIAAARPCEAFRCSNNTSGEAM